MTIVTLAEHLALRETTTDEDAYLRHRAIRLYPESGYLQSEWMRAVRVVRQTQRGWLLEHPVERRPAPVSVLTS